MGKQRACTFWRARTSRENSWPTARVRRLALGERRRRRRKMGRTLALCGGKTRTHLEKSNVGRRYPCRVSRSRKKSSPRQWGALGGQTAISCTWHRHRHQQGSPLAHMGHLMVGTACAKKTFTMYESVSARTAVLEKLKRERTNKAQASRQQKAISHCGAADNTTDWEECESQREAPARVGGTSRASDGATI